MLLEGDHLPLLLKELDRVARRLGGRLGGWLAARSMRCAEAVEATERKRWCELEREAA
jgi:hypothetical protein